MVKVAGNMAVKLDRWERLHRFTSDEYQLLGQKGIMHEDDRVELIEGRIIDMTPIGSRHASCVDRLNALLARRLQEGAIIRVQNPINLNEYSEPKPDISILKPRSDFYSEAHPTPQDVLFIIEVADASLEYDRTIKIPLYAKNLIQEVWIVNLLENALEIYRSPVEGNYEVVIKLHHTQAVTLQSFPDISISVDEIVMK